MRQPVAFGPMGWIPATQLATGVPSPPSHWPRKSSALTTPQCTNQQHAVLLPPSSHCTAPDRGTGRRFQLRAHQPTRTGQLVTGTGYQVEDGMLIICVTIRCPTNTRCSQVPWTIGLVEGQAFKPTTWPMNTARLH